MSMENLLSGVEDTLYIPLVARIYVSEKFPKFFYDGKALFLKQYIPKNLIEKNANEYFHMASVCRQDVIDKMIMIAVRNSHSVRSPLCNLCWVKYQTV